MKLKKKFMLGTTVQLNKIVSSQIAKVKIYVMYEGKNRNHTHFTKQMIEQKLVPTMYGMPIIGEYLKEKSDFGGHGGKVIITDDGIEYEQTTVAYGFIPESSEMRWETVEEVNGLMRDYLVADAYVWYKRFPEVQAILDEPRNQSMEIEIKDGIWSDELNSYDIKDAEFTGACILGLETEPCFEGARIGKFALEQMKFELSEMAKELKETLKSEVKEMSQELETQVEETVEVTEVEEAVEATETEEVTQSEPEVEEAVEAEVEVEETQEETQEEAPATEETEEPTEEEVEETATEEDGTECEQDETQEGQEETQEPSGETECEQSETVETVDYAQENAELKAKVEAYEAELAELRAFKATVDMQEKQEVVDSFASEFTAEELQPVVEKMEQFSKEDLEIQLFAMLGRKQKQFSLTEQKEVKAEKVVTVASFEVEEVTIPSWARAIEQHQKK